MKLVNHKNVSNHFLIFLLFSNKKLDFTVGIGAVFNYNWKYISKNYFFVKATPESQNTQVQCTLVEHFTVKPLRKLNICKMRMNEQRK